MAQAEDEAVRNDFMMMMRTARTLAHDAGLALEEESAEMRMLQEHLMGAFIDLHAAAVARLPCLREFRRFRVGCASPFEVLFIR